MQGVRSCIQLINGVCLLEIILVSMLNTTMCKCATGNGLRQVRASTCAGLMGGGSFFRRSGCFSMYISRQDSLWLRKPSQSRSHQLNSASAPQVGTGSMRSNSTTASDSCMPRKLEPLPCAQQSSIGSKPHDVMLKLVLAARKPLLSHALQDKDLGSSMKVHRSQLWNCRALTLHCALQLSVEPLLNAACIHLRVANALPFAQAQVLPTRFLKASSHLLLKDLFMRGQCSTSGAPPLGRISFGLEASPPSELVLGEAAAAGACAQWQSTQT